MKNIKRMFKEDPYFAVTVIIAVATIATGLIGGSAKLIEASAYAHRASKMK
jgi:hypothetical protein